MYVSTADAATATVSAKSTALLHVDVYGVFGAVHDELKALGGVFAHQLMDDLVGLKGVADFHAKKAAGPR